MNEDKRKILEKRRKQLQTKIEAEEYIERHIHPTRDLFEALTKLNLTYYIAGLVYTPMPYLPYVEQEIAKQAYLDYGFHKEHMQSASVETILEILDRQYPTTNSICYVPALTAYANYYSAAPNQLIRDGLKKARKALALLEQEVYVYYMQYGLVLRVSLDAICLHDHEDLFSTWTGEVLIFSEATDWLITFTLEEEWLGGKIAE